ncbi:MAG: AMP-binding protein, partial [Muribaculaceae bacterium]|nr:AMP-binding protein [Muribaculaceae bacterium]
NIEGLMAFVKRHDVTIVSGFPYLLADMNKLDSIPESIRLLISGGDVLRAAYIDRLRHSGVMIYNTYGPSETTVCATYKRCDNIEPLPDGAFPIGRAVKGVNVSILNNRLRPVKRGAVGEICITGEGVSLGYLGYVPESVNFVILPDGRRLYRSGDLGYELPDGDIVFLHRRDEQVMILGQRVEPEEVENVLNLSPEVDKCVVRHFTDEKGMPYLVAYFVARNRKYSLASIKQWLRNRLPDYMIPEFFVVMKSIPVTLRGKVDVEQLPIVLKDITNS